MIKRGIINPEVNYNLSMLTHMDKFLVSDSAMELPKEMGKEDVENSVRNNPSTDKYLAGKNIVKVILENYGFEVIDLGRDVPVETVVETVREKDVHLVGLSALMTTTLKSMEETIAALHAAKLDCKVMVGGAVLTPEYAEKIGADWYAKDAKQSADIAKEFFGA